MHDTKRPVVGQVQDESSSLSQLILARENLA